MCGQGTCNNYILHVKPHKEQRKNSISWPTEVGNCMKQFPGKDSKIRLWDKMTFSVEVNAILKSYLNNSEVSMRVKRTSKGM